MTARAPSTRAPRAQSARPPSVSRGRGTDWVLVAAAGLLSLLGVLLVWSATVRTSGGSLALRQLVAVALGVAVALAIARLGRRRLRLLAPVAGALGLIGLVLVLTPLGSTINGSRSWILLPGGLSVQPAEPAKLALVLVLATVLARPPLTDGVPRDRQVLLALGVCAVPLLLVLAQPDLGSAVVMAALALSVLTASAARARWVLGLLALGAAAVVLALTTPVLDDYQRERLLAFADPDADPQGYGYQTRQVRIAIGSGGLLGQGLMSGAQTQGGYVPFDHTDFVLSVAGEEWGLAGTLLLLLLAGVVLARTLLAAWRAPEPVDRLMAAGVAGWLGFQVFQNVGMNVGLVPVTGLPLPFVSYGGSSMVAVWAAVGLVLHVHARSPR